MDPISNQIFSHDFQKFVLQDPNVRNIYNQVQPPPPFELKMQAAEKSKKAKKDLEKQKKQSKADEKKDQNKRNA